VQGDGANMLRDERCCLQGPQVGEQITTSAAPVSENFESLASAVH